MSFEWGVEHRRDDGRVVDVKACGERQARDEAASCNGVGLPCVLVRRASGAWLPVLPDEAESEATP